MKKFFKGWVVIAAILFFCAVLVPSTVRADIIVTPDDELSGDFYDQSQPCNRTYIVNVEEGFTYIYKAPDDDTQVKLVQNGTSCYIECTYQDIENTWGMVTESGETIGWVWLDQFYAKYDNISFQTDYSADIKEFDKPLDMKLTEKTLLWEYPGSVEHETWNGAEAPLDTNSFTYLYTDEDGREWGFMGYFMGRRDKWVCLSDPENAELPVRDVKLPTIYDAVNGEEDTKKSDNSASETKKEVPFVKDKFPVLPVILVSVVVIGAVVLLVVLSKKKNKTSEESK